MIAERRTITATRILLVQEQQKNVHVWLRNIGPNEVAIGGPTVTFATGFMLQKNSVDPWLEMHILPVLTPISQLWAVCDTGKTSIMQLLLLE